MIVDELIAVLGYDVRGEANLRRFNQSLDATAKRIAAASAAIATIAGAASGLLARSVVQTSAMFEKFQATLETVEGSADKARESLDWITDFAKKTPFEVSELTMAFVRLRAYGLNPTNGLLEDLGNASSAMGKTLMDAVEMIADASTGEFERLKEFGIRASQAGDQVTFSWTENGKTLNKTVKKSGDEITKFLQERFGARFSGAMEKQSKTWNGMMSNLSDAWTDFQRRVGNAGFFEFMKQKLKGVLEEIERLDADGSLDRWAKSISDGLTSAMKALSLVFDRLSNHFRFIANWISSNPDIWNKIKIGLLAIAAVAFPKTAALLVLEDILSWMQGADSVIGDFAQSLSELTGIDVETLGIILATLVGAAAGLGAAVGPITAVSVAIRGLAGALGLLAGGAAAKGLARLGALGAGAAGVAGSSGLAKRIPLIGAGSAIYQLGKRIYDDLTMDIGPTKQLINDHFSNLQQNQAESPIDYGIPLKNPLAAFSNAQDHLRKMNNSGVATQNTINDSSDRSVNVHVGPVTVNNSEGAGPAVGAAVGQAVGNSAANAAKLPPTRYSTTGSF